METRKVQKVGGGTYTVSIPVQWAQEHDIEAGGTAYLYTHRDGSLVVRWNEKEHGDLSATEITLDDENPRVAERMLREAYTAGFGRITLRSPDCLTSEQRRAVAACSSRLAGAEIAEETDDRIAIQCLFDASDVSVRQSALQLRFTALSMHDAATAYLSGETDESDHIVDRHDEVERTSRLIRRHSNRSLLELAELDQLGVTRPQLFAYDVTARRLERVADHAVTLVRCVQRTDRTVSGEVLDDVRPISADARLVVADASDAVINDGPTTVAHSALDRCEQVVRAANAVDETLLDRAPEEAYVTTRVLDSLVQTARCGGDLAALRLRTSIGT
ncbi:phosphate uptake regulator PhoU [Halorubrum sp. AD140]|uniref:phosphate uptake regulator PhoU n=1 Tax=Halorubrum sp. AD140 TaxID=3050073 RepID=UPI002ACCBAC8|nr:phosphate uptake regulator PhoU [Halorubrum sp. AD140]MDZ5812170.1 phosphate uptake regulator PhoU [Halorubrum sp. AD140]